MKSSLDDLAVFGGAPAFAEPVHVGRPSGDDVEPFVERVRDAFHRRWFTNDGPYVQELEERLAARLGVRHCVATCNATAGLEIAIRALNLTGEVIVPSFTFVATAHALEWMGITPVFCDVDRQTHNLDPGRVESLVTPRTSGILGVHLWGRPCDPDGLAAVARRHSLRLFFDAAHAFGCAHQGRMIGGFGDAEVFSFHATKVMTTFEGGAITTNDASVADKARLLRSFGFQDYDRVEGPGINGKMNEISAAMGLTSLDGFDRAVAINRAAYLRYRTALAGIAGIDVMRQREDDAGNFHYLVVEVERLASGLDRDLLHRVLWAEQVFARRYFYPGCHRMPPYCDRPMPAGATLANTEWLTDRVLCLPTGRAVAEGQIEEICAIVRLVADGAGEIRRRMSAEPARAPTTP